MYNVKFKIGRVTRTRTIARCDHESLLKVIAESGLLGCQEVWFSDPDYDDDGLDFKGFSLSIIVDGSRIVGRLRVDIVRETNAPRDVDHSMDTAEYCSTSTYFDHSSDLIPF